MILIPKFVPYGLSRQQVRIGSQIELTTTSQKDIAHHIAQDIWCHTVPLGPNELTFQVP